MDIKDVLSVGLTPEDFELLLKGLDAIPEKSRAEALLTGTMGVLLTAIGNETRRKEAENHLQIRVREAEKKIAAQNDDLQILKSKLILLKRLLLSNEAIRMTKEILSTPRPNC